MLDLLIVGGGPAGLATAIHAVRAGLDVAVAEPRPTPVDKACGEGLMPGAVRALDALGVTPKGHVLHGIRYLDAAGGSGQGGNGAEAAFRHGNGLGVRRTVLHEALALRAAELGVPVRPFRVDPRSVRQDGEKVTAGGVAARYLVAADGLHSPLRRSLGLDLPDPRPSRYGLRRHFAVPPWTDHVEVHWSARAEAYVTPLGPELLGVAVLTGDRAPFDEQLARFPALCARLAEQASHAATAVRGAGPLRQRVRARVAGRILLVGDAAGYVDALTGEGVSLALTGAAHLVRCVREDRPAAYERAWSRASRRHRLLTHTLVRARAHPALARRIVPTAARLPAVFTLLVNGLA
ncbi:NAD(P)/FAD-dependent oxidoreductase [Streptacidiphilus jiangxiensis]|uniref:Dehydrogenase (Flavoprotein) n=1 Tax=Streptacidiphilus jiangxiensis TaxID=235985 RepID=A0A1H7YX08_STRJI|nr:NAD(P)/FAD-dependent oxidoreductase [Streptacidiphilus jiangxiensis]SEM50696.1 Dehydrogenase (flavoprotein) [Streptacidiphilus jiangxiensis]